MSDRHAELRAQDPHGRRSSYQIESQVEGEEVVTDVEDATSFDELKYATLRLARFVTGAAR